MQSSWPISVCSPQLEMRLSPGPKRLQLPAWIPLRIHWSPCLTGVISSIAMVRRRMLSLVSSASLSTCTVIIKLKSRVASFYDI